MCKLLLTISMLFVGTGVNADIAIIVHPASTVETSKDDIVRLYTGRSNNLNGAAVEPLNLSDGHDLRNSFDNDVLGRSPSQVKAYWSKLVFTGKGSPPKEVGSAAEVIDLVAKNPNIIGYVSKADVTDNVKVVTTF